MSNKIAPVSLDFAGALLVREGDEVKILEETVNVAAP
jgi:hypothetical protein